MFRPGVQKVALSIGRANGKTTLTAAVAVATVDGPLVVPRGETLIVASSFDQARIAFRHCLAFLRPRLVAISCCRVVSSGGVCGIRRNRR